MALLNIDEWTNNCLSPFTTCSERRDTGEQRRKEGKTSPAGLIDAYPLYLKYYYRPNKYYLIIHGGYSVPEKDVYRCRQRGCGRKGVTTTLI